MVFDPLEGIFPLMSPDPLAFLRIRRCVALTFLKGFVGIWKGTALAIIKSSLLIHLLAAPS